MDHPLQPVPCLHRPEPDGAIRFRPLRQLALLLLVFAWSSVELRAQVSREYDLKAAFLYNFTAFVTWPEGALPSPEIPFVIGVLGHDPFGAALDEIVAGEKVGSHALTVRRLEHLDQAADCQILFVSASEARRVPDILKHTANRPVLTVSDLPDFARAGGVVGFSTENNQLRLHINAASARRAGLTVSSKLLRLARVIDADPPNS